MNHRNFLNLDIHTQDEGRCLIQVGIDHLTPIERGWLFKRLEEAKEGREIQFGAKTLEGGTIVITFAIAPMTFEMQA